MFCLTATCRWNGNLTRLAGLYVKWRRAKISKCGSRGSTGADRCGVRFYVRAWLRGFLKNWKSRRWRRLGSVWICRRLKNVAGERKIKQCQVVVWVVDQVLARNLTSQSESESHHRFISESVFFKSWISRSQSFGSSVGIRSARNLAKSELRLICRYSVSEESREVRASAHLSKSKWKCKS